MTQGDEPLAGKISAATFQSVIAPQLGAPRSDVLVGPRHGVDGAILDLGGGQAMSVTTDPFFVLPELGWERAAWFAVHIVASDAATSGLRPAYLAVDLNLPQTLSDRDLGDLWEAVHATCEALGVAIITGHTARYDGCSFPMVGGATVMGTGPADCYVTPAMARAGDLVIVTKGAAVETVGMFGACLPDLLQAELGADVARAAAALFPCMSVVDDAMIAVQGGVRDNGVSGMHDATERGIWGGLVEIAEASHLGMAVEQGAILLPPVTEAVCSHFGIDPFAASSEGTLLLTCRPHRAYQVVDQLVTAGIPATVVGEMLPLERGLSVSQSGHQQELRAPLEDPFWPAFQAAMELHQR